MWYTIIVKREREASRRVKTPYESILLSTKCEIKNYQDSQKTLDKLPKVWYNENVKGVTNFTKSLGRKGEKKFAKPLDKLPKMCYNKNVPRRYETTRKKEVMKHGKDD